MEDEHSGRSHEPSHDTGTRKGEEMASGDSEPGREGTGSTDTGRPTGTSSGRFSTGINPEDEEPIDPESPIMPPP
ncbi:MAG: hypothetical protein NVS4B2_34350 [Chloroflexota bacterium]